MATIPSQPLAQAPMSLGPTNSPTSRSLSATFSDPAPYQFTQYYRNGPLVPDNAANSGIPTSGPIALSQFVGATSDPAATVYQIQANTQNLDLFAYASDPARPAPTRYTANTPGVNLVFQIGPGVYIGSATVAQNSISTNTNTPTAWHPTVSLTIVNQGIVLGAGGAGGNGGPAPATPANGQGGGTAITAQRAVTIQNAGTFAGGGGGGSGGGWIYTIDPNPPKSSTQAGPGGGGGAGANTAPDTGGAGGAGGIAVIGFPGSAGQPGTWSAGGNPGPHPYFQGAAGGGRGVAGDTAPSTRPTPTPTIQYNATLGVGGAAGYYAKGNANITWQATGTRQGQVQPTV